MFRSTRMSNIVKTMYSRWIHPGWVLDIQITSKKINVPCGHFVQTIWHEVSAVDARKMAIQSSSKGYSHLPHILDPIFHPSFRALAYTLACMCMHCAVYAVPQSKLEISSWIYAHHHEYAWLILRKPPYPRDGVIRTILRADSCFLMQLACDARLWCKAWERLARDARKWCKGQRKKVIQGSAACIVISLSFSLSSSLSTLSLPWE